MTTSIHPGRVSHPNVVVEDYEASLKHFQELFGAEFLLDLPKPEWHACLIEIGGVILEMFAPPGFLLHARIGPHVLGFEYEATMQETRAALEDHKVRIIRELGVAVHTHPADAYGVAWEFYEGSFIDNKPPTLTKLVMPTSYWRDEHPLGLAGGLKSYSLAVSDLAAASKFFQSFLAGEVVYEEARPALAAKAVGLQVADCVLELISPTGDGALRRELEWHGQGIRSLTWRVKSLEQARRYFAERKVEVIAGTAPDAIAIPPEANRGLLFEFAE
jgi:catechol 2,3-dioxygenase-like lactoylglutathione lyase family enzyme